MKIQLIQLTVRTRRTAELIEFAPQVTFLHGPIGRGKSTVARLIDYCLGGKLEQTPAIQHEFLSAELVLILGTSRCFLERSADDSQGVRVSWRTGAGQTESLHAPLTAQESPILGGEVFNLSDLLFWLCDVHPIKVRKRTRDPDSDLVRLSFRDIWWYCYLDQTHLDSSFYKLEDPFRRRKSQDAMRFFTGLYSDRLNQLEQEYFRIVDAQRAKREAVAQIRTFMSPFGWSTDIDLDSELAATEEALRNSEAQHAQLERSRSATTHPTDALRAELRHLGSEIEMIRVAIADSERTVAEQVALRAELITAKVKSERVEQAGRILEGIAFIRCPECGTDISDRPHFHDRCRLCGSDANPELQSSVELEALRKDLNERIDQIAESISRRQRELARSQRQLAQLNVRKQTLDSQLQVELSRYDSAFVESIRGVDREIATYTERIRSLRRLQLMPRAITEVEEEAGAQQGVIDRLKSELAVERERLKFADENIRAVAVEFKRVLLAISFPGISDEDEVTLDPRNWQPTVTHQDQDWGFWDTGSGGKKTLFNVCYALAVHRVGIERSLPVPNLLIIDGPTKNISDDENPELIRALYDEIYKLAAKAKIQFVLIDSDLVRPVVVINTFIERRMAGKPDAPSLISYYVGP
ncbi:MAG: hypothetical protein EBV20_09780 [Betaproteobacteria bacterium]|jgi:AAA domain|nr:hypothetical protein [Betaproteobacteria bacterium]NBP45561.1 hypothetical protein [Betaproteobacteria bacterium]